MRALAGTLLGSAPGLILPFAINAHFGAGRVTDAYFFAYALLSFGVTMSQSVIEYNGMPVLNARKHDSTRQLRTFIRRFTLQSVGVVCLGHLVVFSFGAALLSATSWGTEQRTAALTVAAIFGLFMALTAASSATASALYVFGDFFSPTASVGLRSLAGAISLGFIGADYAAVSTLALAVAVGEGLRLGVLRVRLRRKLKVWSGARPDAEAPVADVRGVWRAAAPQALSLIVVAAAPVVDRAFAAPLTPGSISVLDLGEKIFYLPQTALASSIVLVASARWAAWSRDDAAGLRSDWIRTNRIGVAVSVGLAAALGASIAIAAELSDGTLAGTPAALLRNVTLLLLVGVPGATLIAFGSRFLTATQQTYVFPFLAVLGAVVNVVADFLGARYFGVAGIAAATSLVRYVNGALYVLICIRLLDTGFARLSVPRPSLR